MAFTRTAALLHAALSDVVAGQHHTATVAGDLNLADLAARAHGDLSDAPADAHHVQAHTPESHTAQGATAAELETLTDGSSADSLHDHAADPAIATLAEQVTGTSVLVATSPGRQQGHPSAIKVWASNNAAGTSVLDSFNLASLTDNNTGERTYVFGTDFADTNYAMLASVREDNIGLIVTAQIRSNASQKAVGSCKVVLIQETAAEVDRENYVAFLGTQ